MSDSYLNVLTFIHERFFRYGFMIILSFTANQPLVDTVSSCVKDIVVLILDLIFYRAHCKSVERITAGHCKFKLTF